MSIETPIAPPNTPTTNATQTITPPPVSQMNTFVTKSESGLTMKVSKRNSVANGFKIVDGEISDSTGKVVLRGLHKMAEISITQDTLPELFNHIFFYNEPFNGIRQFVVNDGTMIRLYHTDGEWKMATNRRVDANNASFGTVDSFGRLFTETAEFCGLDYSVLNPANTYTFVMKHPENRIVEPTVNVPMLYHIETICTETGESVTHNIGIKDCIQTHYTDIHEMIAHLMNPETPWWFQGFMLINSRGERLKMENPHYTNVHKMKGNIVSETKTWRLCEGRSSYSYRLFQIILANREEEFEYYFPEFAQEIFNIKKQIYDFAFGLWETYKHRFIFKNKEYPQAPELKTFLNNLHYQYHTTHEKNTETTCLETVMACPITKLMHTLGYIEYKQPQLPPTTTAE